MHVECINVSRRKEIAWKENEWIALHSEDSKAEFEILRIEDGILNSNLVTADGNRSEKIKVELQEKCISMRISLLSLLISMIYVFYICIPNS